MKAFRRWLTITALLPLGLPGQADVLPPGRVIAAFAWIHQDTGDRFDFVGDRSRIIPSAGPAFLGQSITDVLAIDVAAGLWKRLDAHLTIPFAIASQSSIQLDGRPVPNAQQSPSSAGLSNIRFGGRYQLLRRPLSLTAKFDVKLSSNVPNLQDQFNGVTLPIREGQNDFDISVQASKPVRIMDYQVRVGGEIGYRFRTTQNKGAFDTFTQAILPVSPGNEILYNLRLTVPLRRRVALLVNGDGQTQQDYAVPFRFTRIGENGTLRTVGTQGSVPAGFKPDFRLQTGRRLFTLGPLLSFTLNQKTFLTGGVGFSVNGRNFPAGPIYSVAITRIVR